MIIIKSETVHPIGWLGIEKFAKSARSGGYRVSIGVCYNWVFKVGHGCGWGARGDPNLQIRLTQFPNSMNLREGEILNLPAPKDFDSDANGLYLILNFSPTRNRI